MQHLLRELSNSPKGRIFQRDEGSHSFLNDQITIVSDSRSLVDTKRKYFDPLIGAPIQVQISPTNMVGFEQPLLNQTEKSQTYITPSRVQSVLTPTRQLQIEKSQTSVPRERVTITTHQHQSIQPNQAQIAPGLWPSYPEDEISQTLTSNFQPMNPYNHSLLSKSVSKHAMNDQNLVFQHGFPKDLSPARQRHEKRLQRISQQNLIAQGQTKTWEKFEKINDDLKQDIKDISSSILQTLVDTNVSIIDLFSIIGQENYIDSLIKHPRFLPDTVERFLDVVQ